MRNLFFFIIVVLMVLVIGAFFVLKEVESRPAEIFVAQSVSEEMPVPEGFEEELPQKIITEQEIEKARLRSGQVRGVYAVFAHNRSYFKNLLKETKLNGIVIDVKEYHIINLSDSLKSFVEELQKDDVWTIARIVVFRDSLVLEENPEWYLKAGDDVWQDRSGYYWLDPQNQEALDYIVEFSKKVIDFGFDELQFDYIRYPADYTHVAGSDKVEAISRFFAQLNEELKEYDPSIILSVDLFGYIAFQERSLGIGQDLIEAEKHFDYLSFMLYPSHFYHGFDVAGVRYNYPEVVKHPYEVIYHSIVASGFPEKTRPFLQDFNLRVDTARGISYDAEKIKAQIRASEDAGTAGWLFWNPKGTYTKEAFKQDVKKTADF